MRLHLIKMQTYIIFTYGQSFFRLLHYYLVLLVIHGLRIVLADLSLHMDPKQLATGEALQNTLPSVDPA